MDWNSVEVGSCAIHDLIKVIVIGLHVMNFFITSIIGENKAVDSRKGMDYGILLSEVDSKNKELNNE